MTAKEEMTGKKNDRKKENFILNRPTTLNYFLATQVRISLDKEFSNILKQDLRHWADGIRAQNPESH